MPKLFNTRLDLSLVVISNIHRILKGSPDPLTSLDKACGWLKPGRVQLKSVYQTEVVFVGFAHPIPTVGVYKTHRINTFGVGGFGRVYGLGLFKTRLQMCDFIEPALFLSRQLGLHFLKPQCTGWFTSSWYRWYQMAHGLGLFNGSFIKLFLPTSKYIFF